ncbi:hypothetical protein [Gymnodinialimonas ceratoperidinii]|uniref:Uncharacterized protein n=1 Tax=Gymnodinialimonas ceratoperidinii TaxID=2856823 RepID=A0A8F6TZI8_9RHOB|nr:hypothetical protein [Gymnodinialimonas ceratoperidinii]QXT41029.1 hypothetical protein KYE46_07385 [Gymnodinialimonas ceratoperidinii]
MKDNDHIERHLELCQRIFERLLADGTWPWADSQNPEDLVESKDTQTDL